MSLYTSCSVAHDRRPCFRDESDYLVYLLLLHQLSTKAGCAIHTYCLMTNHVHLLLTPRENGIACGNLMRDLGQRYVQYFNRRHARTGTLWEGRFRSCLVESPEYVLACYRYIEMNPVRAGMVNVPSAYRWSSHKANIGQATNKIISPHAEYLALALDEDSRLAAYRCFFDQGDQPAFLTAVRDATNGGYALIGDRLKARLAGRTNRRIERGKPGRRPRSESVEPSSGDLAGC